MSLCVVCTLRGHLDLCYEVFLQLGVDDSHVTTGSLGRHHTVIWCHQFKVCAAALGKLLLRRHGDLPGRRGRKCTCVQCYNNAG